MGLFDRRSTAEALQALLQRERDAILRVDMALLAELLPQKEDLLRRAAKEAIRASTLKSLSEMAERNNALLAASAKGIRSAVNRIKTLKSPPGPLQTYDLSGRKTNLAATPLTLERKA